MILDYNSQKAFQNSLDIVDIGNVVLRCTGEAYDYYIVTCTRFGKTKLLKFGPIVPDIGLVDGTKNDVFDLSYKQIDYKETKLLNEISLYVNDTKKAITDIEEISIIEFCQAIPDFNSVFMEE